MASKNLLGEAIAVTYIHVHVGSLAFHSNFRRWHFWLLLKKNFFFKLSIKTKTLF